MRLFELENHARAYAELCTLRYSLRRFHLDCFLGDACRHFDRNYPVYDVGGHKPRTRGVFRFEDNDLRTICLNVIPDKGTDIVADGKALPLPDGGARNLLCSEVLEHVRDPGALAREIIRVLAPGGCAVISVPFLIPVHADPEDHSRWTRQGLESLFNSPSDIEITIEEHGGVLDTMFEATRNALRNVREDRQGSICVKLLKKFLLSSRQFCIKRNIQDKFFDGDASIKSPLGYGIVLRRLTG